MTAEQIIKRLLELQTSYARVSRITVTNERMRNAVIAGEKDIDLKEKRLREPLLEHVGHLPMIATFLHSHIEHCKEVNLGRALIMLSIHDIGETIVGDILTFKKTKEDDKKESDAAHKILSQDLLTYYKEFELCESLDAKFAMAIDTLGPFLYELESPNMTKRRFKENGFDVKIIEERKRKYFEWDSVLFDIFNLYIESFSDILEDRGSIFFVEPDLPIK